MIKKYTIILLIFFAILLAVIIWRNNSMRQKNEIEESNQSVIYSKNLYQEWKNLYIEDSEEDSLRVIDPSQNDISVSEGLGYGMLFSVFENDKDTFDKLYKYTSKYQNENGFMNWKISAENEVIGTGAATDAEEDIAYSLCLAYEKWNDESYLNDARLKIENIEKYLIDQNDILLPGDEWGNLDAYNPSYFAPEYYLKFYEITNDSVWLTVLEKNALKLSTLENNITGLLPDWSGTYNGNNIYGYESVRIPIRLVQFVKNKSLHQDEKIEDTYTLITEILNKEADYAIKTTYQNFSGPKQINGENTPTEIAISNNVFLSSGFSMILLRNTNTSDTDIVNSWAKELSLRSSESYYGDSLRLWSFYLYENKDLK